MTHLADSIHRAHQARGKKRPVIVPFITAGYPSRGSLVPLLSALAPHAAAIEIGVPFSDPMADGVTIQNSSRVAIARGATLSWLLDELAGVSASTRAGWPPLVLMGYLNPFLSMGFALVAKRCGRAGVSALIIPDLPLEDCAAVRTTLKARGIGLVQLVSPVTAPDRLAKCCAASDGFIYVVATTGVTGGAAKGSAASAPTARSDAEFTAYLARVKAAAGSTPVCVGFGISTAAHVSALGTQCEGAIVGSAVIRAIDAAFSGTAEPTATEIQHLADAAGTFVASLHASG